MDGWVDGRWVLDGWIVEVDRWLDEWLGGWIGSWMVGVWWMMHG